MSWDLNLGVTRTFSIVFANQDNLNCLDYWIPTWSRYVDQTETAPGPGLYQGSTGGPPYLRPQQCVMSTLSDPLRTGGVDPRPAEYGGGTFSAQLTVSSSLSGITPQSAARRTVGHVGIHRLTLVWISYLFSVPGLPWTTVGTAESSLRPSLTACCQKSTTRWGATISGWPVMETPDI